MIRDLDDLLSVLSPEATGPGRYRATSLDQGHGVVFGGQLLAQTLVAGARAAEGKEVRSLHVIFARGATPSDPLDVDVDVVHAGRSFASASVRVRQGDRDCTAGLVLAHAPDPDLVRHAVRPPDVEEPEALAPREPGSTWDIRIAGGVDLADPDAVGPAELCVWTRFDGAPDDLVTSQALLAYASDGFLIGTAMRPHAGVGQSMAHRSISTTVLTHTLTFHEPFRAAEWLLLAHESPVAGRGRAYGRAHVFTGDGRLVASFAQEAMIRAFDPAARPAGDRPAQ